jgi:TRAP-type C4-dicarboxylate transport system substrate-binding protein
LQQNTIDGQENPLVIFYTAKLYEVNKYLSMTSHCYSPSVIIINSDVFNSYPQDVQDAILRAEKEARKFQRETSQRMAVELVEKIKAEGVTITEVDVEEWKEACMPVYEKLKDEIKPELIEAFQ